MNYKLTLRVAIFIFTFFIFGCTQKPNKNEAWIEGKLAGESFPYIIIEELTPNGIQKIDSVAVINNKFSAKLPIDEIGFYFLRFSSTNFISIILEPGTILKLESHADSLAYPTKISGSPENAKMLELNHKLDDCYRTTDSLSKIFKQYQNTEQFDSVKQTIDTAYSRMFNEHKKWLETFITQNQSSITTIVAFYQTIGRRSFFNAADDFLIMQSIDSNLQKQMPKNKHVVKFHSLYLDQKVLEDQRWKSEELLQEGKILPQIILPDKKNETVDVLQVKSNKKLIFFWNIQSLIDHPDRTLLKSGLNGYKVIAISFEQEIDLWRKYTLKEFPAFIHLIEYKGMESSLARTFNLTNKNLPFYVIVDKNNRIIGKGKSLNTLINK